jgi:hypothetical protein
MFRRTIKAYVAGDFVVVITKNRFTGTSAIRTVAIIVKLNNKSIAV